MREVLFDKNAIDTTEHEEEVEVLHYEEMMPLFDDACNPNASIFVVPTQEGADKDDQWNGSIGDATQEHIYAQRHKLLELEHFVHMPNGNLFRTENNVSPPDEDGQRALKHEQFKVMTARNNSLALVETTASDRTRAPGSTIQHSKRIPIGIEEKDAVLQYLRDEIIAATEARAEKQDALDQVIVPFDDWEMNPQMTNVIDIPSTPAPMFIYAGNTSQIFYDWVAEDHPDLRRINSFLSMANGIDWDHFNSKTVEFFEKWLMNDDEAIQRKRGTWVMLSVPDRLLKLCKDISESEGMSPSELTIQALQDIEHNWFQQLSSEVIGDFKKDPVVQELNKFEEQLKKNRSAGKLSWAELGKFGQVLYKKYSSKMSTAHWSLYKQLKKRYAPEVRVVNIDVNRANLNELRAIFQPRFKTEMNNLLDADISEEKFEKKTAEIRTQVEKLARQVYFSTPFMSLEDLAKVGLITIDDIGYTDRNVVLISMIKKAYRESINFRSLQALGKIAQQIITLQRKKPEMCTEQEWYSVWQVYRIGKTQASKALGIQPAV